MKHLQKFNEYYIIDPNFDAFENEVTAYVENKFKSNKNISFVDLKKDVIDSLGGMHEFKYGDDFSKKLTIIDNIVSNITKGL